MENCNWNWLNVWLIDSNLASIFSDVLFLFYGSYFKNSTSVSIPVLSPNRELELMQWIALDLQENHVALYKINVS